MSRKSCMLCTDDVPKYIREIVSRLYPINTSDPIWNNPDCNPGYTFKLYGRRKIGAKVGSQDDVEKLIKWAKSWYAHAELLEEHMWYNDVPVGKWDFQGTRNHRAKAYRLGFRNHWYIVISDPVCQRFEKDGFYRK